MTDQVEQDDFELEPVREGVEHSKLSEARRKRDTTRRAEAMSLLMAGMTYEQIGDRLEVSQTEAINIISRVLRDRPATGVDDMRTVENARLDRAQTAIWTKVLEGDSRAIGTLLHIMQRRARLNGLDAPMQIEMSVNVRAEMEQALNELQDIVLGEVIYDSGDSDSFRS